MVVHTTYSQRLLESVRLPTAKTDLPGEVARLQGVAVPLVHELQRYQRADGSVEPQHHDAAAAAMSALGDELRRSDFFPERSLEAYEHDLAAWRAVGLESPPRFDASRDAIEGPDDKKLAMFAGPAFMPNSDTRAPLFQLVLIMRDEPDSLHSVREDYPHLESACQSTRVLTGSRQAREGQCVVLFPENVPASSKVAKQKFAWFFMNKHTPPYQWALDQIHERCGDSLFAEGDPLSSPQLDAEGLYDTRCCWAHLHEHHHQVGPRPLARNLALKTQWYTGLLEELKVDCQTLQACLRDVAIPYRWEVLELVLFDRLFRYPCADDALCNCDAGAGVLLGTWLLRNGTLKAGDGRAQLASRAETVRAVDALVGKILALEELDGAAYMKAAQDFTLSVLDPPARAGEQYAKPADWLSSVFACAPGSLAGAGDSGGQR
ncbi:MAG TPA: DUF6421 family protein [Streptosporangiaceae bacterium]|nr:DUF6421 family protein [Streptosporangiaceae bacterium]